MRRSRRAERSLIALLLATCATGCVRQVEPTGPPRLVMGPGTRTVVTRDPEGAVTRDASFQLSMDPLPPVDTDGFQLPLLSPDGRQMAWQSRNNADWPTLLAQPASTRALQAVVSGRPLGDGATWSQQTPMLLGRMGTAAGVLVEAPQSDGSRWIGLAPWDGSQPTWLVKDGNVNAFAAIGPRGELAWCRRAADQTEFDLVVERPEGRLELPRRAGESWMMPVVSADGVYAASVRDGILELAFLPIRAGQSMSRAEAEPALLRQRISLRGTPRNAYQMMVASGPDRAATPKGLLLFHPELRRMTLWNPRSESMTLLAPGSVAAWMQSDGSAIVSLPDRLVMQEVPPDPGMAPLQLIPGLWIVRGTDADGTLLAGPGPDNCRISRLQTGSVQPRK